MSRNLGLAPMKAETPLGQEVEAAFRKFGVEGMFGEYIRTIDLVWRRSDARKVWERKQREEAQQRPDENRIGGFRKGDPSTSQKGALDVFPRSGTQRNRIVAALWNAESVKGDPHPMNHEDIRKAADFPVGTGVWKRMSELERGGWVNAYGQKKNKATGSYATSYILTDKARRFIKDNMKE